MTMLKMAMVVGLAAAGMLTISVHAADWPGTAAVPTTSISLNGDNPITHVQGTTFTDPGATCVTDGESTTASASGSVNEDVTGSYIITYSCADGEPSTTRLVAVYNTPPVLTVGESSRTILVDELPPEPPRPSNFGATCTDTQDGNLTEYISVVIDRTWEPDRVIYDYFFTCTDTKDLTDSEVVTLTFDLRVST